MLARPAWPLILLLTACKPRTPAAPPEPPATTTDCTTAEACRSAATSAVEHSDKPRAAALFGRACDLGDGPACDEAGILLDTDAAQRLARFRRACELDDASGCANLARATPDPAAALVPAEKACGLAPAACDLAARFAIDAKQWEKARALAERGCTDTESEACGTLGALLARGLGGPQDPERAGPLLGRGCEAGDANACENYALYKSAVASGEAGSSNVLDVPNASLTVGSVTADGFTMKDLECALEGGGLGALMAGPMIAAAVGARKAALKKCAPKGGEARVRFTMRGSKTAAEAKAATPAIAACVVKAIESVPAVMTGTCAATLDLRQ